MPRPAGPRGRPPSGRVSQKLADRERRDAEHQVTTLSPMAEQPQKAVCIALLQASLHVPRSFAPCSTPSSRGKGLRQPDHSFAFASGSFRNP